MRFTKDEIKKDLLDNWENITDNPYPEDALGEYADGYLPTYTNEIIAEWAEMPSEFDNSWQGGGFPSSTVREVTITELMTIDLYNYYRQVTENAYNEILSEEEEIE
jgi:hypothetical protein